MRYRRLGKTGLYVSEIGLGGWINFSDLTDYKTSKSIIKYAFENGVNFFDTADSYNFGKSEEVLGKILKDFPRQELVISTKCFFPLDEGSKNPNLQGLSRKHIFESVNSSLRRLKIDYIDLFQFHRFDKNVKIEETVDAINDLIKMGKVLYYGVSKWQDEDIIKADSYSLKRNGYQIASSQDLFNLFHRDAEKSKFDFCHKNGVGFLAYSPLARGVLSDKYLKLIPTKSRYNSKYKSTVYDYSEENLKKVAEMQNIAKKYNCSISQIALAYYLSFDSVTSLIVGCSNISQIKDNVKSTNLCLEKQDINLIKTIFDKQ
jgi:aryl-alcohol dehydrogenase-like predicted oxidoreductase